MLNNQRGTVIINGVLYHSQCLVSNNGESFIKYSQWQLFHVIISIKYVVKRTNIVSMFYFDYDTMCNKKMLVN